MSSPHVADPHPASPAPASTHATPASTAGATASAPPVSSPGAGATPGGGMGGGMGGGGMPLGAPPTPPPAGAPPPAAPPAAPPPAAAPPPPGGAQVAPVPVSAARAERDAAQSASRRSGSDPLELARRIGAALNVGVAELNFTWLTGLTVDGTIVVANNYGLGYIPQGVQLPDRVKFASVDESIPIKERASWTTYPVLALQGWAQAHDTTLRAVIGFEEQFRDSDPGVATVLLQPEDLPTNGRMEGRSRLEVLAPQVAARLSAVTDAMLVDMLPPAPADPQPPEDRRFDLMMEVFRPLLSSDTGRAAQHLTALIAYANHLQELALHDAYTAADGEALRAATADAIYWQHISVMANDALSTLAVAV
ncbi:secretion protein EccK [Mycobacterium sp. TNTM28]|uniref:Secretion protein EccK n=1 Tax=[Mycobacterium] fortunisiensis TaxID=2600579 RepID=A0ABS6KH88_9MYCO|nr:secretion protein EccK [[Mycobacterium] fortunisiensis]MBU9762932.1 secretion protein EccK [[Mycobacterium] fortunisiensis]